MQLVQALRYENFKKLQKTSALPTIQINKDIKQAAATTTTNNNNNEINTDTSGRNNEANKTTEQTAANAINVPSNIFDV